MEYELRYRLDDRQATHRSGASRPTSVKPSTICPSWSQPSRQPKPHQVLYPSYCP